MEDLPHPTLKPAGVLLCDDLLFASRVTATAQSLGKTVKVARSSDVLKSRITEAGPRFILVDLANPGLVIEELVSWVHSMAAGDPKPRIVAYGSHVDAATLKKARAAGCDDVLTRSQLVEQLENLLGE